MILLRDCQGNLLIHRRNIYYERLSRTSGGSFEAVDDPPTRLSRRLGNSFEEPLLRDCQGLHVDNGKSSTIETVKDFRWIKMEFLRDGQVIQVFTVGFRGRYATASIPGTPLARQSMTSGGSFKDIAGLGRFLKTVNGFRWVMKGCRLR